MSVKESLERKYDKLVAQITDVETKLKEIDKCKYYRVSIFGSRRLDEKSKWGQFAFELARRLAWEGIDVVTGGGPGLMAVANAGARKGRIEASSKAKSFGLVIKLPMVEPPNNFLDVSKTHPRFMTRLENFFRISTAFVALPGGIGTALELFYGWQLLVTGFIKEPRPFLLVDSEFWRPLMKWIEDYPVKLKLIDPWEYNLITIVDELEEALRIILQDFNKWKVECKLT